MNKGDEVKFWITGNLSTYKGVVTNPVGYHDKPEIRVTEVRDRQFNWHPCTDWPILKDGDYVIRED